MITTLTVLLFGLLLLVATILTAWMLRVVGRRLAASHATWSRAFAIALAGSGYQLLCLAIGTALPQSISTVALLTMLGMQIPLTWLLIVFIFGLTWPRAVLTWVITTAVVAGVSLLIANFGFKPYLIEAFVTPANSMAPTLLGKHITGTCPRCGADAFGSPYELDSHALHEKDGLILLICSRELQSCQVDHVKPDVAAGDRFLVNKQLVPQRWDMVAFRFPADPTILYVKRLVGLPGEEVVIRDGGVWIDGERLAMPEPIGGLRYVSELGDGFDGPLWGSPERPAKLGQDEYFVLGDFSQRSSDSRAWREGAPGHPSYALPKANLVGVVTHIYWPPGRQRTFK